jgi:hypothetical protein
MQGSSKIFEIITIKGEGVCRVVEELCIVVVVRACQSRLVG